MLSLEVDLGQQRDLGSDREIIVGRNNDTFRKSKGVEGAREEEGIVFTEGAWVHDASRRQAF